MDYNHISEHMVRGKKIESPLDGGVVAKIWYAAYLKPRSGYQLAKQVFGTKEGSKQPKTPSKIYQYVKEHQDYFKKISQGESRKYKIKASLEPMLDELERRYEKISETEMDKRLRKFVKERLENEVHEMIQEGYIWNLLGGLRKKKDLGLTEDASGRIIRIFLEILDLVRGTYVALSEIGFDNKTISERNEIIEWTLKPILPDFFETAKDESLDIEQAFEWIKSFFGLTAREMSIVYDLSRTAFGGSEGEIRRERYVTSSMYKDVLLDSIRENVEEEDKKKIEKKEKELNKLFRDAIEDAQKECA